MITAKEVILDVLNKLPDDATMDDILYNLYIHDKVERGLEAVREGRTITQEEMEKEMEQWIVRE